MKKAIDKIKLRKEKTENRRKTRQDSIFMHDGFLFFVFFYNGSFR